jgi:CDR ABC transporter.
MYQAYTLAGASNATYVDGFIYLYKQYNFSGGYLWRGVGVVVGFWFFFVFVTAVGFENLQSSGNLLSA